MPKILLALGATCLLVAALVFLAVTWASLGIAGRTLILVLLTLVTGGVTTWMAGRALRGATEALGLVTVGLVVLDVVGARNAGWLGDPSDATFLVVLGAVLAAGGTGAAALLSRTPVRAFTCGEAAAVLGTALLAVGLGTQEWASAGARLTVATLVTVGAAAVAWRLAGSSGWLFRVAAWGASVVAGATWLALLLAGVDQLGVEPSVRASWGGLAVWPLLAAAAVAFALSGVRMLHLAPRVVAAGAGLVAATLAVLGPALDEGPSSATGAVLVAVAATAAVTLLARRPWAAAGLGVALLGSLHLGLQVLILAVAAGERYADAAAVDWAGTAGGRFRDYVVPADVASPWLLPVCVVVLMAVAAGVARLTEMERPSSTTVLVVPAGALLGVVAVATLVLHPVPVWLAVASLLALAAGFTVPVLRRDDPVSGLVVGGFSAGALVLGRYDESTTLAALVVSLVLVTLVHLTTRRTTSAVTSGVAVPPLLAGLAWTAGAMADLPGTWAASGGLLLLGAAALARGSVPTARVIAPARLALEVTSLLAAVPLAAGVDSAAAPREATWAALYLTLAGAATCAMALMRPDRRSAGWLGGLLLAAATWVRLHDLGVEAPEPYTLPTAVALLVVGWRHLARDQHSSTHLALGPGLGLALVPSALWVLEEPLTLRALLLGLACLALVVGGVQARWSAPLVHGAAVGAVVVLREAGPYVGGAVPRWALIGAAGVLLIVMGVTWEQRLQQARTAARYVSRLR